MDKGKLYVCIKFKRDGSLLVQELSKFSMLKMIIAQYSSKLGWRTLEVLL